MSGLSLSLLGPFEAAWNDQPLLKFRTNRVQALLIYLATENVRADTIHRREPLMDLLWPGLPQKSAQVNLRQTLYHLRKAVPEIPAKDGAEPLPFLLSDRQTIQINPDYPVESDLGEFARLLNAPHDQWAGAVELYRGDFLSGFYLADAETFEEWAAARRAAFLRQALDGLSSLATIGIEQGDHEQAESYARRQLEIDNLREVAYRQLMTVLARTGRRSEAVAEYEAFRKLLQAELDLEPSTETQALCDAIRAGELEAEQPTTRKLRGYELKEQIGVGSFGAVYRAFQPGVNREVAIKIILPRYANDPKFIRRFEAEARMIGQLEHPRIVPLYDYWRESDSAYLVLRWLRGGSLREALADGPLEPLQTAEWVDQIAAALNAAHRQGVIHRDLKPSNILLDEEGNAYLTDFGLAMDLGGNGQDSSSGLIGSPAYISPEQVLGDPISRSTDIYSLGVVIYELLTGEQAFPDESLASLLYKHVHEPLPPVHAQRTDLPESIDEVIQKATAKNPGDRFQDAAELARAFREALLPTAEPVRIAVEEIHNPYKGLAAFTEADSGRFFGREALTQRLLSRLSEAEQDNRFLAIVGPSGSGKSSLVMAGLVPALRKGALPGSENWYVVDLVPGPHPFEEVEAALLRIAVNPPASLLEQLTGDERGLLRAVKRILPAGEESELLLIIDQFEEVFTLVEDPALQSLFLDSLVHAATDPRSRIRVLITLRADFYDRPLLYAGFSELVRQRTEVVVPLSADELGQAIRGPAERVGVQLETGLVTTIVAEVAEQPGGLPLLQYALTELFERREGQRLTNGAYRTIGGVLGALGRRAEEMYAGLDDAGRAAARQLFLRLVRLGEGTQDTRRRVLRSELAAIEEVSEAMEAVIEAFGKARLLSFDHDPRTRGPTVEVAHEALLREWQRLREWLDASRSDVRMQRVLGRAAAEYLQADRDASFLLRGSRLDQFEGWAAGTALALTSEEQAFLDASAALRDRERAARERLRRRITLGLAAGFVIAVILTVFALNQSRIALRQAAESHSLALTVAAQQALTENRRVLALQLAVEANRIADPPDRAQTALYQVAYALDRNHLEGGLDAVAGVAFSPDGRTALYGGTLPFLRRVNLQANFDTSLILSDIATRAAIWRREAPAGVESVAFSPDGRTALTGLRDGTLILWDIASGEQLRRLVGHAGIVGSVAFRPDGRTALSGGTDGDLLLWDIETGEIIRRFEGHGGPVESVAVSPDGQTALSGGKTTRSGGTDGDLLLWDIETGEIIRRFEGNEFVVRSVAFSPDGKTALAGAGLFEARTHFGLWDVETGEEIRRFEGHQGPVTSAAFSPDGRMAISGSSDNSVVEWDIETGEILHRFEGHTDRVLGVAFSPDGRMALSASLDGTVRFWHLSLEALMEWIEADVHVREFKCDQRELYRIEPLCDADGSLPVPDA